MQSLQDSVRQVVRDDSLYLSKTVVGSWKEKRLLEFLRLYFNQHTCVKKLPMVVDRTVQAGKANLCPRASCIPG